MSGFVYFIGPSNWRHRRVKIGFTKNQPQSRLADLQTGCPYPLELMAWVPTDMEIERMLHEAFAPLRLHGEWFRLEGRLAWLVCELHLFGADGREAASYSDFCRLINEGLSSDWSPDPVWGSDDDWMESSVYSRLNDRMHDEAWPAYQAGLTQ